MASNLDLFAAKPQPRMVLEDEGRGWAKYIPDFLSRSDSDGMFNLLVGTLDADNWMRWSREAKSRYVAAFGDPRRTYSYAKVTHTPVYWPDWMEALRNLVFVYTGCNHDFALLNYYADGDGALGWHSDREADLDPEAPIASVSLGGERDFQFRADDGLKSQGVILEHGSLLIMSGRMQDFYKHQVPAHKGAKPRMNITFRKLKP